MGPCFDERAALDAVISITPGEQGRHAGLWAVPWLEHAYDMSRVTAAQHASALLYVLSWLPLLLRVDWPVAATLAWFLLMGLLIPGFTLSCTIAKEVNRPEHSGIATSVVNVGIFLGAGLLQPTAG